MDLYIQSEAALGERVGLPNEGATANRPSTQPHEIKAPILPRVPNRNAPGWKAPFRDEEQFKWEGHNNVTDDKKISGLGRRR